MCYNTHGDPPSQTPQATQDQEADTTPEPSEGSSITASAYCVLLVAIGISALLF